MATSNILFDQADSNHDGRISQQEFGNFIRKSIGGNDFSTFPVGTDFNNIEIGDAYGAASYERSTSGSGGFGADLGFGGAGYGASSYEASSYRSSVGNIGADLGNLTVTGAARASNVDAASTNFSSVSQTSSVQQYETDAQGNFKDANPQVIRRAAATGPVTYTQNIRVRFLQPPAVPPPGPLIIKEVRPPQPPPPAPLRVRQQAPPLPQPPPLVLRERPPPVPASVASQTIVRNLAAVAVPPRSVLIERIPAAPQKPRDIIIERWIPYGAMAERKTVVQRAEAAFVYPKPRNIIVQYDAPQVRAMRQFQRMGVTQENPEEYIRRYGATLLDTQALLQQARAAGVVEDISPPPASTSVSASRASEFSSSSATNVFGFEGGNAGAIDIGAITSGGGGGGGRSSFYGSSAYSATGDVSGLRASLDGLGSSSFESASYTSSTGGLPGVADTLFAAVDTNNDGVLSRDEFQNAGF